MSIEIIDVPPDKIIVNRDSRQRKTLPDSSDLLASIARNGILNPLIINSDYTLIAGERRLRCALTLNLKAVPCRLFSNLTELEARIIELEENIKRSDLSWQEICTAVANIHKLFCQIDKNWTVNKTAQELGMKESSISLYLHISKESEKSPKIMEAPTYRTAYNIAASNQKRRVNRTMEDLLTSIEPTLCSAKFASEQSIICADFAGWVQTYEGPRFNVIHCDFPYGIDIFSGAQARKNQQFLFDDSPEVFFRLTQVLLTNLNKICQVSAHILFWYSHRYHDQIVSLFEDYGFLPAGYPLIWLKSDNVGICPDPTRQPRHIYETALLFSRGDRPLTEIKSDAYAAPTDNRLHVHCKPEPMLRHFFRMIIDPETLFFDPTCGSGSALRAAESLGAKHVLGIEKDAEMSKAAERELKIARTKRALSPC